MCCALVVTERFFMVIAMAKSKQAEGFRVIRRWLWDSVDDFHAYECQSIAWQDLKVEKRFRLQDQSNEEHGVKAMRSDMRRHKNIADPNPGEYDEDIEQQRIMEAKAAALAQAEKEKAARHIEEGETYPEWEVKEGKEPGAGDEEYDSLVEFFKQHEEEAKEKEPKDMLKQDKNLCYKNISDVMKQGSLSFQVACIGTQI